MSRIATILSIFMLLFAACSKAKKDEKTNSDIEDIDYSEALQDSIDYDFSFFDKIDYPESNENIAEMKEQIKKIHEDGYVLFLRRVLDGWHDRDISTLAIPPFLVDSTRTIDMQKRGLKAFNDVYFKDKFILLYADKHDMGGRGLFYIFINHPDKIFYSWVYPLSDNHYELRDFRQVHISDGKLAKIKKIFVDPLKEYGI